MFTLRPMLPTDGPALQALMENDPPAPGMAITTCFRVDPYTAWRTLQPSMIGVVAEAPDSDGLIGVATAAFDEFQFEGRVLPSAFIENVKVHNAYRGQGLGAQLMLWLVDRARERFGDDLIISGGTTSDNTASIATMGKWSKQVISSYEVAPRPARSRPPTRLAGITIRAPQAGEYAEIADKSNRFFADYNLYPPLSAEKLTAMLTDGVKHYRVAVDRQGNILAGAMLSARGGLMVDEFRNVPLPLRIMNAFLHLIPPDKQMRLMEVAHFWFDDLSAAQYLWEMIRWEFRDRASTFSAGHDPRGPMPGVLRIKPWHIPKMQIVLAINGPELMGAERLVCSHLRG